MALVIVCLIVCGDIVSCYSTLAVACVDVVSIWCVEDGELQRTLVPEGS